MPELGPAPPLFTALHTNHLIMIGRCFHARARTTQENIDLGVAHSDGTLSLELLSAVDPAFASYIRDGYKAIRLRADIMEHPSLVKAVVASFNHDLALGETEGQLLVSLRELLRLGGGAPDTSAASAGGGASVAKTAFAVAVDQLKSAYPRLEFHVEPMAKFVEKFGSGPFLSDLVEFHSEHVNAKFKTEPQFWEGLSRLRAEFGWAPVAFAKENWASDKAANGMCRGVSLQTLKSASVVQLDLLHQALGEWRKAHKHQLELLAAKVRARILGRLDIFAARVLVSKQMVSINSPVKEGVIIEIENVEAVYTVVNYDLAVALSNCDPESRGAVEVLAADIAKLEKESKESKKKVSHESIVVGPARFDDDGNLLDMQVMFSKRGFVDGAEITASAELEAEVGGKSGKSSGTKRISRREVGKIVSAASSGVTANFQHAGLVVWSWQRFPAEKLVVTSSPVKEIRLERPHEYPLSRLPDFEKLALKGKVLTCLELLANSVGSVQTHVLAGEEKGRAPLVYHLHPRKLVTAACKIAAKRPLLLLPMTHTINFVRKDAAAWLKTEIECAGGQEVVVLQPLFVDPVTAKAGKAAVVEFFWLVRRSSKKEECNMNLSQASVVLGAGMSLHSEALCTKSAGKVVFPVMVSTRAIEPGAELVCHFDSQPEPPIKKAKVGKS